MKTIRLEFPFGKDLPKKIWLKVDGNRTFPFEDNDFTSPIPVNGEKFSLEVNVPDELTLIEFAKSGGSTPDMDIYLEWYLSETDPNWKIPGLKKVTIVFDDRTHDVPIINERPDINDWNHYMHHESNGLLFLKRWALVVYTLESQTVAVFHWHSQLIKEFVERPITMSKHNFPCMWEKGGQLDEFNGSSTIICDEFGNMTKPLFIRRKGQLSCSEHALIIIHKNYVIIEVLYQEQNMLLSINILKIVGLNIEKSIAETECVERLLFPYYLESDISDAEERIENACDNNSKITIYKKAIISAYKKATCFHCKKPHFIRL